MATNKIFHSYDVRGLVGEQLDEKTFYKIGNATANALNAKKIAVGYDMRETSQPFTEALIEGITDAGVDVINLGMIATEQLYFEVGRDESYDGGIIVTASHNPAEYNGAKIVGYKAKAIGLGTGLEDIQALVETDELVNATDKGSAINKNINEDFANHVLHESKFDLSKKLKIAVDAGNGIGGLLFDLVFGDSAMEVHKMYFKPDGTFPNHEPNPKLKENVEDLIEVMKSDTYDVGIALDGDSDRVMLVDSEGRILESVYTGILIGNELANNGDNKKIVHDPRITLSLEDAAQENDWQLIEAMAGRSFMKKGIMEEDAVFAFENSGHFLYQNMYHADSSAMTIAIVLNALMNGVDLVAYHNEMLDKYPIAGEVNFRVEDPQAVFDMLENEFSDAEISKLDGISLRLEDWRMNVRKSNTEPVIRLNLEASSKEGLKNAYFNLLDLIKGERLNDPINPILL